MKCAVCDHNEATMKITVTKLDGEVWDSSELCYECAKDPAAELCLIIPQYNK